MYRDLTRTVNIQTQNLGGFDGPNDTWGNGLTKEGQDKDHALSWVMV